MKFPLDLIKLLLTRGFKTYLGEEEHLDQLIKLEACLAAHIGSLIKVFNKVPDAQEETPSYSWVYDKEG